MLPVLPFKFGLSAFLQVSDFTTELKYVITFKPLLIFRTTKVHRSEEQLIKDAIQQTFKGTNWY